MTEQVYINEVGPRDGLQNQTAILSPTERLQLINALVHAGLKAIEIGAFVSPKAVPTMAHTDQVVLGLPRAGKLSNALTQAHNPVQYSALIPNQKGYQLAKASGIESMALVIAASNTMNQKNIGLANPQAMRVCESVIAQSLRDSLQTRVYIATAWACPFEGQIQADIVVDMAAQLLGAGAAQVIIADTIGAADPAGVTSLMSRLGSLLDTEKLCCHFHDTRGMALANVYAALNQGIRHFDTSIGGLGGCPFAPGASGNVATEDVVLMLSQMGFDTGIDLAKLVAVIELVQTLTGHCEGGHASRWLKSQLC